MRLASVVAASSFEMQACLVGKVAALLVGAEIIPDSSSNRSTHLKAPTLAYTDERLCAVCWNTRRRTSGKLVCSFPNRLTTSPDLHKERRRWRLGSKGTVTRCVLTCCVSDSTAAAMRACDNSWVDELLEGRLV